MKRLFGKSNRGGATPIVDALEARLLFSADGAGLLLPDVDADDWLNNSVDDLLETDLLPDISSDLAPQITTVVFVDARVDDYESVVSEFADDDSFKVVLVGNESSGLQTMTDVLMQLSGVESVHVISHSDGAGVRLGSDWIDADSVQMHRSEFLTWQNALSDDADLLFYGCNLAATAEGVEFMQLLAQVTGADVAASDDQTGHEDYDADWELEKTIGEIDSPEIFSDEFLDDWYTTLAVVTVDTVIDEIDGDVSSITALLGNAGADGVISLREAVIATNNTAGADEIHLPAAAIELTRTQATGEDLSYFGDLDITDDLVIEGQGMDVSILEVSINQRLLDIHNGNVTLRNLGVHDGLLQNGNGGALLIRGGVTDLEQVHFDNNRVNNSSGGAIYLQAGTLRISNSEFTNNYAQFYGGAIYVANLVGYAEIDQTSFVENDSGTDSGAIHNSGTTILSGSEFRLNTAVGSGGALTSDGTLILDDSSFIDNTAGNGGGAILTLGYADISGAYFDHNIAVGDGGALSMQGNTDIASSTFTLNEGTYGGAMVTHNTINVTMQNLTVVGNKASMDGAGFYSHDGTTTVQHSTFSTNIATGKGGAVYTSGGSVTVANSIFSQNEGIAGFDEIGNASSAGFNLAERNDATTIGSFSALGDMTGVSADLGPLQNNGGPVPTMAIGAASHAIDAGSGAPATDATGTMSNEFIDIGAFEYRSPMPTNKVYWTDQAGKLIYRATELQDGSHALIAVQSIATTSYAPRDIEFDETNNRLFWTETDGFDGRLVSSDVDGLNAIVHLETGLTTMMLAPYGLAIDQTNNVLYIVSDYDGASSHSYTTNKVLSYDISGTTLINETIVVEGNVPTAPSWPDDHPIAKAVELDFTVDPATGDRWLFWADQGYGSMTPRQVFFNLDNPLVLTHTEADFSLIPESLLLVDDSNLYITYNGVVVQAPFDFTAGSGTGTSISTPDMPSGLAYDDVADVIWLTLYGTGANNGFIIALAPDFSTNSIALNNVSTPRAITLVGAGSVNAVPVIAVNTGLPNGGIAVVEGGQRAISSTELLTQDAESGSANLVYTLINAPQYGALLSGATVLAQNATFTQADINNSLLSYQHNGSENFTDNFRFEVSDGTNTLGIREFDIAIVPVNENTPTAVNGSITLQEGAATSVLQNSGGAIDLLSLAADVDSFDNLTFAVPAAGSGALFGAVTVNPDGTFSYQHDGTENYTDSFDFTVTDDANHSTTATIAVVITPVNDESPDPHSDSITVTEGGIQTVLDSGQASLLANDLDADLPFDTLTAAIRPGFEPQFGTVVIDPSGTFTYEHDDSENFTDSFEYIVSDAANRQETAVVNIVVQPVNDNDFTVANSSLTVVEGTSTNMLDNGETSLLYSVIDPDVTDTASITSIVQPTNGSVIYGAPGTFIYTHNSTETTTDSFTITVEDSAPVSHSNDIVIAVAITPVNNKDPQIPDDGLVVSEGGTSQELQSGATNLLQNLTDADSVDSHTLTLVTDASFGLLTINPDNTFSYTHDGSENVIDSFVYLVEDAAGHQDSATISITVNPVNDNTPMVPDDDLVLIEGTSQSVLDSGRTNLLDGLVDDDAGDTATLLILTQPQFGSINVANDNTFLYTHDGSENFTDQFTYSVTDAGANSSIVTIDITVAPVNENAPVVQNDALQVTEGSSESVLDSGRTDLLDGLIDVDVGDSASMLVQTQPQFGSVIVANDNTFIYTHDGSENFADQFTYSVIDAGNNSSLVTIDVAIFPVNENSPVVPDDSLLVVEGGSQTLLDSGRTGLLDGLLDDDVGDSATLVMLLQPQYGSLNIAGDNTFSYTHDGSENFVDKFTYNVIDAGNNMSTVTVDIIVTPVNDNSPVVQNDTLQVVEGGSQNALDSGRTDLLSGLLDDDTGDSAVLAVQTQPQYGSLSVAIDNSFVYTHGGSENFTDQFVYSVTDPGNNSSLVTIDITVIPINENSPFVPNDTLQVSEGGSQNVLDTGRTDLLDGLVDVDVGDSALLIVQTQPLHGSVIVENDNTFTYTHDGSENFTDKFTYSVIDAGSNSSTVTIDITVAPVNDNTPVVQNDTLQVSEGGSGSVLDSGRTDLLDGVVDDDQGDSATVSMQLQPQYGSVSIANDNTFTYTHDGSENLVDQFTYSVADAAGNSSTATVDITVTAVNDPPIAQDFSILIDEDTSHTFAVTEFGFLDLAEGDAFHGLFVTAAPSSGELLVAGTGVSSQQFITANQLAAGDLVYVPGDNLYGPAIDSFQYRVVDAGSIANSGDNLAIQPNTVTININPVNDSPVAQQSLPDLVTMEGDLFTEVLPTLLFQDVDNDPLSLTVTLADGSPLPQWLEFDAAQGLLGGIPTESDIGTLDILIVASDGQGGTSGNVDLSLQVIEFNEPPSSIVPGTASVDENLAGVLITPLTVIDADSSDSSEIVVDDGRFEIINGELWLIDPDGLDHEVEPQINLMLTATDQAGNSVDVPFSLLVNDVNDTPVAAAAAGEFTGTAPFNFTLPDDLFVDQDGDGLTYSIVMPDGSALPDWLSFDPLTNELVISGEVPVDGVIPLLILASDGNGGSADTPFSLVIEPVLGSATAQLPLIEIESVEPLVETVAPIDPQTEPEPEAQQDIAKEADSGGENLVISETEELVADGETVSVLPTAVDVNEVDILAATSRFVAAHNNWVPESVDASSSQEVTNTFATQVQQFESSLARLFQPTDLSFTETRLNAYSSADKTRETMEQQQIAVKRVVQTSVSVSTGVSVGYIVWMLRGGALIGSVLSSLPAWRLIDPLPVLESLGGGDDSADDESLESMVKQKKQPPPEKSSAKSGMRNSGKSASGQLGASGSAQQRSRKGK